MTKPEIWNRVFTRDSNADTDTLVGVEQQQKFQDRFGQFLQHDSHWTLNTLDGVLSYYYNLSIATPKLCNLRMFMIADGAHVNRSTLPDNGGKWFNPHCRVLGVVDFKPQGDIIFIVGSDDVHNSERFMQVASWDQKTFHYYAGNALNAFTDGSSYDMSYLGPFNGHVNGACIMKEIHDPWYHWKTDTTDLKQCLSEEQINRLKSIPYISPASWNLLGNVSSAEGLEGDIIKVLVPKWFQLHRDEDFKENGQYKSEPANLHRWMAHLLLTTTINIATGAKVLTFWEQNPSGMALPFRAPTNLFMNFELLLQSKFNDINGPLASFSGEFSYEDYQKAVEDLQLGLLQEWDKDPDEKHPKRPKAPPKGVRMAQITKGTLGGGKQTDMYDYTYFLVVQEKSEGEEMYFITLQTSLEDSMGVLNLPDNLVSQKLLHSILLVDFCNPVYSWRRGVLMQYLPKTTKLVDGNYDMEAAFVATIRASSHASEADSPELQFLKLYDNPPSNDEIRFTFQSYLDTVTHRIKTSQGLTDYMKLAEARRRIYRPLPLDEFGLTLPYALALPTDWKLIEMTQEATVTEIPERGLKFLKCWTGTLHGFDPKLLPTDGCYAQARGGKCPRR
ncbi:hypothetical protein N7508_003069 [Penicillium antarcticum]|uniref:uncharacterized protein n=1 Tax=Penicillium antarcticum TaxID=416450 RepID=UPI00239B81AB|nr:uncharacterized protein N7508_003069 [Penicillium antarcticum]KAJ5312239.1 hypothetical protein N7508_003069 [Penicillium antarcticum]